ncbi:hypothetical protein GCM10020331_086730 [Ectobacillus funiculus]
MIASMFIGNIMLLILNMPLVKVFAKKLLKHRQSICYRLLLLFLFFGVYAVQFTTFDLLLLIACGIAGYYLTRNDFPVAPLVLGLVLGPMIENNMRRALTTSNGDYMIFLQKPVSLVFFLLIAVLWMVIPLILKK